MNTLLTIVITVAVLSILVLVSSGGVGRREHADTGDHTPARAMP